MKFIAAIPADFERTIWGTRARLGDDLLGESVLRRTLQRVLASRSVASVHLLVPAAQEAAARRQARDLAVQVELHEAPPVPWRDYVAGARKWSLDAWRGGIGGMTIFDEDINPWVLSPLAAREQADVVAVVPAAAPLFDPALLDAMIAHYVKERAEVRMVFTQAAPGLAATLYLADLLADLARAGHPPGKAMAYIPAEPKRDMVMQPCYYSPEAVIVCATGRCIVDTDEARKRVERILQAQNNATPDARTVSRHLAEEKHLASPLPGEIEIELTTDDPLSHSVLRPRGAALGRSASMSPERFDRLMVELAARDDVRVVLGGFGDPLLHPQWRDFVRRCRQARVFALALRTPAIRLDDAAVTTCIEERLDVLNVLLDAATPATYARVHGEDCFERVIARIDAFLQHRHQARSALPLLVCELMKTQDNMEEMEAFYDHWITRTGSALISGPSHFAGCWPDRSVTRMAPPGRFACQRVFHRVMVLADGRVLACDQDFRGAHAIGSLETDSLSDLWTGPAMRAVRERQLDKSFNSLPLCARCDEWHRP